MGCQGVDGMIFSFGTLRWIWDASREWLFGQAGGRCNSNSIFLHKLISRSDSDFALIINLPRYSTL
jgi:hypothetical protein